MPDDYLLTRLELLRASQGADGGWGYVAGKASWIEPTAYAMLALHGRPGFEEPLERAWSLLQSWQLPDGAWRPASGVEVESWATALAVTLHVVRGDGGDSFLRGVDWLVGTRGAEGTWLRKLLYLIRPKVMGTDPGLLGWPWLPGTGSWVEPTCHALVALRLAEKPLGALGYSKLRQVRSRIDLAERMMWQRRATDGGWNYGNRIVLGEELPSYPETTGVALVGMRGAKNFDPFAVLKVARRQYERVRSPLARAWLAIGLRSYGEELPPSEESPAPRHLHVAALEALAAPGGNHALLTRRGV